MGCGVLGGMALRPARRPRRLILIAGGLAGVLIAANPEQPGVRFPVPHMICAAAGGAALVAWSAGAWRRGPAVPWGLRPAVWGAAVVVLAVLLAWPSASSAPRRPGGRWRWSRRGGTPPGRPPRQQDQVTMALLDPTGDPA
jgi:hypothetical protein